VTRGTVLPGAESGGKELSVVWHAPRVWAHQETLEGLEAWVEAWQAWRHGRRIQGAEVAGVAGNGRMQEAGARWRGVELVSGRILSGSVYPGVCVCRVGDGMESPVVVSQ
jgi:hypothetical protein